MLWNSGPWNMPLVYSSPSFHSDELGGSESAGSAWQRAGSRLETKIRAHGQTPRHRTGWRCTGSLAASTTRGANLQRGLAVVERDPTEGATFSITCSDVLPASRLQAWAMTQS